MIRKILPINLVFTLFLAILAIPAPVQAKISVEPNKIVDDEIIIQYQLKPGRKQDNCANGSEEQFLENLGGDYKLWEISAKTNIDQKNSAKSNQHFRKLKKHKSKKIKYKMAVLKLDKKLSNKDLISLVKKINTKKFTHSDYEVANVFPNYLYEINSSNSDVSVELNDTYYEQQWPITQIQTEKLWQYTKGAGAVVAVIDTGVDYNHEDLADNIWVNEDEIPNNGKDDDRNGYIDDVRGWDFVDKGGYNCMSYEDCSTEDNDPMDVAGHGTHVAGIIAAVQNNNKGITGVAPEALIMPLKAGYSTGRSGFLKTSDILEAITYAINNNADVINMSFAGAELIVLEEILKFAFDLGIVCVAAAGNYGSSTKTYPAGFDSVIAVGAVDSKKYKSYYSNYGDWVKVTAPGTYVLSTIPGNSYDYKTGTSMSAPHVSAVAALLKAKNKIKKPTAQEVQEMLISSLGEVQYPTGFTGDDDMGSLSADIDFPLAIDSVELPSQVLVGTQATLKAKASDSNSEILEYEWKSDVDGYIGNSENLNFSFMSLGSHVIQVRAQNALGDWSSPELKILEVVDQKPISTNNYVADRKFSFRRKNGYLIPRISNKTKSKIKSVKWISSEDGTLGSKKAINLASLSQGFHKISLSVQDINGNWSEPYERVIKIN